MDVTPDQTRKRVLIVEDKEPTSRRLAKSISVDRGLDIVACVQDVALALEALHLLRPHVVLVDLGLPDGSGLDVISACARAPFECHAIVISIFGDEERVLSAIRHGASGYLQKGATPDDIIRGIRSVLQGGAPISPQIARHMLQLLARAPLPNEGLSPAGVLTERELEVLQSLSRGYKRQEVADQFGITLGTVGSHVSSIYKKLEVNSNTRAVAKAGELGLL